MYEWERNGAGSCSQSAGCIYLISGSLSDDEAFLIDASASGSDVFFTSRAELVPQDRGEAVEVYDARVGGGFPEVSQACTGTGCQGVPPAPRPSRPPPASPSTAPGTSRPPPAPPAKGKTAQQLAHERLARALKTCRKKHDKRKRQRLRKGSAKEVCRQGDRQGQRSEPKEPAAIGGQADENPQSPLGDGSTRPLHFRDPGARCRLSRRRLEATTGTYPTNLSAGGHGLVYIDALDIGAANSEGTVRVTDVLPEDSPRQKPALKVPTTRSITN